MGFCWRSSASSIETREMEEMDIDSQIRWGRGYINSYLMVSIF